MRFGPSLSRPPGLLTEGLTSVSGHKCTWSQMHTERHHAWFKNKLPEVKCSLLFKPITSLPKKKKKNVKVALTVIKKTFSFCLILQSLRLDGGIIRIPEKQKQVLSRNLCKYKQGPRDQAYETYIFLISPDVSNKTNFNGRPIKENWFCHLGLTSILKTNAQEQRPTQESLPESSAQAARSLPSNFRPEISAVCSLGLMQEVSPAALKNSTVCLST